jgi:OOP family OmpA-OmpF porin
MISINPLQVIRASSIVLLALLSTAATAAEDPASSPQPTPPGRVVISGAVPDEATKAALLGKLQQLYGTGQVVDQITVGGVVAPPNWSTHVGKLMNANLKSISKGQILVEGTNIAMRGEVKNEAIRQAIASDFANALNTTYVIKNGLRVTAASQAVLDQALADRIIEFESGSALLTESGKAILDEMAEAVKKVSLKKLEVIGHTDNLGAPARNLALSRSRADSVKTYLVMKGIPSQLIGTSGMGADQPIVANTTDEGRKRNRRIEFRVSQ